jgi:hypothetical protein
MCIVDTDDDTGFSRAAIARDLAQEFSLPGRKPWRRRHRHVSGGLFAHRNTCKSSVSFS